MQEKTMAKIQLAAAHQPELSTLYVLDTNVLIHDPTALLNFEEHHVMIPMTVLEELDKLKGGHKAVAADCRLAIREIDKILCRATPEEVMNVVPLRRADPRTLQGNISVLMTELQDKPAIRPSHINDNHINDDVVILQKDHPPRRVVLITKVINLRLKAGS